MDDLTVGAGHSTGDRGQSQFGQVGAGPPIPDRIVHAGGIARGWPLQEGNPNRQPELPAADTGRGRPTGDAGWFDILYAEQNESAIIHRYYP